MQVHGWATALGAEVVPLWLHEDRAWQPDEMDVRRALHRAKAVYLCDPNNPTGSVLTTETREMFVDAVRESGAWLVADQVYRGAEHGDRLTPSLFADGNVVVTAGLSKVFGLPGLRVGWVVTTPELATRIWSAHDYSTIAPNTLSALFAERALRDRDRLIARARGIVREDWPVLRDWARSHDGEVREPAAGAIAFVKRELGMTASQFV